MADFAGRVAIVTGAGNGIAASGLYGNFGQANYGAAKIALVGLMNVLSIEGARNHIRVNALCPVAATGMMKGLVPDIAFELITPEAVTPALLFLTQEEAPSRVILSGGGFAVVRIEETHGVYLPESERTPEIIAARFAQSVCHTKWLVRYCAASRLGRSTAAR
jgi:short chain dehydrogenase